MCGVKVGKGARRANVEVRDLIGQLTSFSVENDDQHVKCIACEVDMKECVFNNALATW